LDWSTVIAISVRIPVDTESLTKFFAALELSAAHQRSGDRPLDSDGITRRDACFPSKDADADRQGEDYQKREDWHDGQPLWPGTTSGITADVPLVFEWAVALTLRVAADWTAVAGVLFVLVQPLLRDAALIVTSAPAIPATLPIVGTHSAATLIDACVVPFPVTVTKYVRRFSG